MAKTYTGNEALDKYLRRRISPQYQINDHGPHHDKYILEYLQEVGSNEDIQYVMEQYFSEDRLKRVINPTIIRQIINLGYCLGHFSKHHHTDIRLLVLKRGYRPENFLHDHSHIIQKELIKQGCGLNLFMHHSYYRIRRQVFTDEISNRAKEIFEYIAPNYKIELVEWNHDKDHIHVLFKGQPKTEISKFINAYKSASNRLLEKEYPTIRQKLWKKNVLVSIFLLII